MIKRTMYRGRTAIEMATERVRLLVVPELGANIASLADRHTGREWLADTGMRERQAYAYGSEYSPDAMSGWDECFPTIVACPYPEHGPFAGRQLPDHGELWAVPWNCAIEGESLVCRAEGRALPYSFQRTLSFLDEAAFRMSYRVTNTGSETFAAFWTAHPLFALTEHTHIQLPPSLTQMLCVDGGQDLMQGRRYSWPGGEDPESPLRLDWGFAAAARDSRKLYAEERLDDGWCGLTDLDSGAGLKLAWDPAALPYFGVWINEGQYNGQLACALEPCNGYYDSLTEAVQQGRSLRLAGGASESWHLDVRLYGPSDYR